MGVSAPKSIAPSFKLSPLAALTPAADDEPLKESLFGASFFNPAETWAMIFSFAVASASASISRFSPNSAVNTLDPKLP
ncbi:hypothetical protein TL16_g05457 [Triparma laevis f. inornata]|uniref:Uncharacterized protein n=1 Tax=Triparma laevis f. inornata TaxID=1714386 RepID=A0A9W7AK76_9STRA|nr:hypothetical protein TL16_g05457 [Triparma laevis f. inornata]